MGWSVKAGLVLLLLLAGGAWWSVRLFSTPEPSAQGPGYRLHWYPCPAEAKAPQWRCGRLVTPGDGFSLEVRRLSFSGAEGEGAPLLYLQGGPGLDADFSRDGLNRWRHWRDYAGLERDLIIMQRRGTGPGAEHRCRDYHTLARKLMGQDLPHDTETAKGAEALQACLNRLPGFDPADYGSVQNLADLQALVKLMELSRWHLYGVSYGSRLALAAAHTPGLQAVILDSVYPPGEGGVQHWPRTLGRALYDFPRVCQSQSDCRQAWQSHFAPAPLAPEPFLKQLRRTLNYLKRLPVKVDVVHDGLPVRVVVNDHRFLSAVFAARYRHRHWPLIVNALHGATSRDRQALAPLVQGYARQALSTSVNALTFMAVDCRDNPMGEKAQYHRQVAQYPLLAPYTQNGWQSQWCHRWPQAEPPQLPSLTGENAPRVILLAGEFDPITPADWAHKLHARWPFSRLRVFGGVGHSVLAEKPCALAQLEAVLSGQRKTFDDC